MEITVSSRHRSSDRSWLAREASSLLTVGLLLFLCLPALQAGRSPLTSDESLYVAEALNIASGKGLTYPTGEPIVHRAPLYPAMLAATFKAAGASLEAAYWLPRLVLIANVLLVFLLARALFGAWAGLCAGVLAAASPYLRGMGTTLFLDGTETAFILGSLLLLWQAEERRSVPVSAASGALLGLAFLVKESAVLLLPLPAVLALFFGYRTGWKRSLLAWYGGFAALTAWWWVWVYAQTGSLFLVGLSGGRLTAAVLVLGAVLALACLAFLRRAPAEGAAGGLSRTAALVGVALWVGVFLLGLEAAAWRYERDYLAHVPAYVVQVFATNVQPAALVGAAWVMALVLGLGRGSRSWGVLAFSLLLFASYFVLVADRHLSLRDLLPVVYLSYVALGGAAAWLVGWSAGLDFRQPFLRQAGLVVGGVTVAVVVLASAGAVTRRAPVDYQDDWHNSLSLVAAAWLSGNLEPGSTVMSSRLYYSHLYFLTGGEFAFHQLPTVEVDLSLRDDAVPPLARRSTLFRWENHLMPEDSAADRWLYLTRYPVKGYFIGLAENDLVDELRRRGVDYVVLSSQDAGFSSRSLAAYFEDNPAFERVYSLSAGPADEVRVYRVDRALLAPTPSGKPAQVTASAYDYVSKKLGGGAQAEAFFRRLSPAGFVVAPY